MLHRVRVARRGIGLRAADLNGKSDPYVVIKVGGFEFKSQTIKKTLNPEWNETFEAKCSLNKVLETGELSLAALAA